MNTEKPYESDYAKKRRLAREKDRTQRAMGYPSKEDQERALELAKQHDRNKQESLQEDGHEDSSSARRAMKTIIEDAGQMLQALEQMDGHLPTWWTNKMAVAANNLNKMRDYLLVSSESLQEQSMFPSGPDDFIKLKYSGLKIAIPVSVALKIKPSLQNKENLKKEVMSFLADLRAKGFDYIGQDQYLDDINKKFFGGQNVARGF